MPQRPPGQSTLGDAAKLVLFRTVKLVVDPLRKSERVRMLVRKLVLGRDANYFIKSAKPAA
jgi:hypothetical protein